MIDRRLTERPRAETYLVEDLVRWVERGRIRLPEFQRPLRWRAKHVHELFDSIWKGYPLGNLLFWQKEAPEEVLTIGPLRLKAGPQSDALYVVDGQQRLTSLAGVLLHPAPGGGRPDIYSLWFDLEEQAFVRPKRGAAPQPHWLPLNVVLDAVELGTWWSNHPLLQARSDLYRRALELGRRIREYRLPAYIVETEESEALRVIFTRLNTSGVAMRETEVFAALHSTRANPLRVLASTIAEARMGGLEDNWLLRCLRAVAGDDLTKDMTRQLDAYADKTIEASSALGLALDFLYSDCQVPHLRLLPARFPLVVLTRLFQLHPTLHPRNRVLLRRWLWRGYVTGRHKVTQNPHLRWLRTAVSSDQDATLQTLLEDAGYPSAERIAGFAESLVDSKKSWAASETKVKALLLAAEEPRNAQTGEVLDVAGLIEESGPAALQVLKANQGVRVLHPYRERLAHELDAADDATKRSHLWQLGAQGRRELCLTAFRNSLMRWCEPGASDHPPISTGLRDLGVDDDEDE